jgi:hypothetical protein
MMFIFPKSRKHRVGESDSKEWLDLLNEFVSFPVILEVSIYY